jgi:hypothetical protein
MLSACFCEDYLNSEYKKFFDGRYESPVGVDSTTWYHYSSHKAMTIDKIQRCIRATHNKTLTDVTFDELHTFLKEDIYKGMIEADKEIVWHVLNKVGCKTTHDVLMAILTNIQVYGKYTQRWHADDILAEYAIRLSMEETVSETPSE